MLWHYNGMMLGKGKRPRDPNQLGKWIVERSTAPEQPQTTPDKPILATGSSLPSNVSEYMAAIGKKGGQIGGKRRLKTMTKEERSKIATRAAKARWKKAKG